MKHALTVAAAVVVTALIAGCEHDSKPSSASSDAAVSHPTATGGGHAVPGAQAQAASTAKPAAAVSAPKVYPKEMTRKGEVYVFASDDAVAQFVATKTPPANMKMVPGAGPNGETVHFETGTGADDALVSEYLKLHPAKK
jgi:hypothetical protein